MSSVFKKLQKRNKDSNFDVEDFPSKKQKLESDSSEGLDVQQDSAQSDSSENEQSAQSEVSGSEKSEANEKESVSETKSQT